MNRSTVLASGIATILLLIFTLTTITRFGGRR